MTKLARKNLLITALVLLFAIFAAVGFLGLNRPPALAEGIEISQTNFLNGALRSAEGIEISQTNFPDGALRSYVSNTFDTDKDGFLSTSEVESATKVDLTALEPGAVKDITGIEHLTAAEDILLGQSALPWADLSGFVNGGNIYFFSTESNKISIITDEHAKFDLATIVPDVSKIDRTNCKGFTFDGEESTFITVDADAPFYYYNYDVGYNGLGLNVYIAVSIPGLYKDITVTTDVVDDPDAAVLITDINGNPITSAKENEIIFLTPQDGAFHYFSHFEVTSGNVTIEADYDYQVYFFLMPDAPVEIKAVYKESPHSNHGVCGETDCSFLGGDSSCAIEHAPTNGKWMAWGAQPWQKEYLPFVEGSYYLVSDIAIADSVYLDNSIDLCLNGYNIEFDKDSGGSIGLVVRNTFNLCDCNSTEQIHKFTPNEDGVWELDDENGTKTAEGGSIIGANSGNGNVRVTADAIFTMYGGNIVGANNFYQASGVSNEGVFYMYGGKISGNNWNGVQNDGKFYMYGGSITDNLKSGVENLGIFRMYGGSLERNCYGLDNSTTDSFVYLEGTPIIKNNVNFSYDNPPFNADFLSYYYEDEYLFSNVAFGELKDGAEIGIGHGFYDSSVTHHYSTGVFTVPFTAPDDSGLTDREYAENQANYFFSDCPDYTIIVNSLNQIEIIDALYPTESVEINETNFPDKKFREEVLSYDDDEDGFLSPEEIFSVAYISLFGDGVEDVKGIEYFVNLKRLNLTVNKLTTLDVSALVRLESLSVGGNYLTKLDLRANKNLINLDCGGNEIDEILFNDEVKLESFYCDNNKLTEISVPSLFTLDELDCSGNYITELDLSACTALSFFDGSYNDFSEDGLKLPSSLLHLVLDGSGLSQIDLSHLTDLTTLYLSDNLFTEIPTLPSTVSMLDMEGNKLTEVNYEKVANVVMLCLNGNALTSFDSSLLPNLEYLYIDYNYCKVTYSGNTLDLTTLPSGFDVAKAQDWQNATVEGNILTVIDPNFAVSYTYDMGREFIAEFNLVSKDPDITDFDLIIDMDFLKPVAGEDTYRDEEIVGGAAKGLSFKIVDADWYDITHGTEWEGEIYAEYYCDISDEGYRFLANTAYYFNIDVETDGYFTFHEEFINAYKLNGQSPVYYEINSEYDISLYYAMPVTGDIEYIEIIDKIEITDDLVPAPVAGGTVLRDEYALEELLADQKLIYKGFIWGDEEFYEYDDFYENGRLLPQLYFEQKSIYTLIITAIPEFGFNFDKDISITFDDRKADFVEFDLVENSISFGWSFETGEMPTVDESEKYISQINLVFGEEELPLPVALETTGRSADALMALTDDQKYTFSELTWMWEDVDSSGGNFLSLPFDKNSTERFGENTVFYIEFTVLPKPGYSFAIDSDENGIYDIMEEVYVPGVGFFMANVTYNGEQIRRKTQSNFWESVYFFNNGALVVRFPYATTGEHGECVYDRIEYDSEGHWTACACGEIKADSIEKHLGGTANCQERAVCSTCNQKYGDYVYHAGGTATCKAKAKCATCNKEYGDIGSHDFSVKEKDEEHHFNKCSLCGTADTKVEHSFDGGVCACGFEKPGLSGWGIAGIAGGGAAVLGGGFAFFWFVIKKKRG